jgi:hypothetical protein
MLKTLAKSLTNIKRGKTINLHSFVLKAFTVEIVLVNFLHILLTLTENGKNQLTC